MNDGNYVRCWTVRCKTRNCDSLLFLDVIGPANRALHALQPLCKPFEIACPECGIQHLYVQSPIWKSVTGRILPEVVAGSFWRQ
jgi:hypothetical protein